MISHQTSGLTIHRFASLQRFAGLVHGVSDRFGGVSEGGYESLNMGLHCGDDPARVLENRRRFCEASGIDATRLTAGAQVHGAQAAVVSDRDAGRGALDYSTAVPDVDALVCRCPNVPIVALSADCPLVIMYDPAAAVAAVMHASWRSTAGGIAAATIDTMQQLGARAERIVAGIAPCVGVCCYEVRRDFVDIVTGSLEDAESHLVHSGGRMFFNLPQAVAAELRRCGVSDGNIETAGICTSCGGRFYSYRASGGRTGRFAAVVEISAA